MKKKFDDDELDEDKLNEEDDEVSEDEDEDEPPKKMKRKVEREEEPEGTDNKDRFTAFHIAERIGIRDNSTKKALIEGDPLTCILFTQSEILNRLERLERKI